MTTAEKPNAFPSTYRIKKVSDFDSVFAAKKSAADITLVVYVLPNSLPHSRIGIVAGRRLGKAVDRNRVRRLVREAFRTSRTDLPQSADIVVVPRKDSLTASLDVIKSSLVSVSKRAAAR